MGLKDLKPKEWRHLALAGGVFCLLGALVLFSKSRQLVRATQNLSGVTLSTLDNKITKDFGQCRTPKCLTMYVSPWCSICRASTGMLGALKTHLEARSVETRIIVGRDTPRAVESYAREFGPGTFVDAAGRFPLQGGVPIFVVSDSVGAVLKISPGVPGFFEPPYTPEFLDKIARWMGALE